jgi:hypothetical protein
MLVPGRSTLALSIAISLDHTVRSRLVAALMQGGSHGCDSAQGSTWLIVNALVSPASALAGVASERLTAFTIVPGNGVSWKVGYSSDPGDLRP